MGALWEVVEHCGRWWSAGWWQSGVVEQCWLGGNTGWERWVGTEGSTVISCDSHDIYMSDLDPDWPL